MTSFVASDKWYQEQAQLETSKSELIRFYIYDGSYKSFKYLFKNVLTKDKCALQITDITREGIHFVVLNRSSGVDIMFYRPGDHIEINKYSNKETK